MKWFRFYSEVLDDPKVQRLPGELFKAWVNLLCLANRSDVRGTLPPIEDVAFALRLPDAQAAEVVAELERRGLLDAGEDGIEPHNWGARQPRSDTAEAAAERKRQQRAKEQQRRGAATSQDTQPPTPHDDAPASQPRHSDGHSDSHADVAAQKQKQNRADAVCLPASREDGADESGAPPPDPTPPAAPPAVPTADVVLQLVTTANAAMGANAAIDQRRLSPIEPGQASSVAAITEWLRDGIPLATIVAEIKRVASSFQPKSRSTQISSLAYFDPAIREAHEKATEAPRPKRNGKGGIPRRSPRKEEYVGSTQAADWPS